MISSCFVGFFDARRHPDTDSAGRYDRAEPPLRVWKDANAAAVRAERNDDAPTTVMGGDGVTTNPADRRLVRNQGITLLSSSVMLYAVLSSHMAYIYIYIHGGPDLT
jgi:hypothetical protein